MKSKSFLIIILLILAANFPMLMTAQQNRPKVALVLGGGGAKGAAEVGVLKYIEQSGIPIDMIVGTSIGSIVGGLYSVGYNAEQLDNMFRSQEWISLFSFKVKNKRERRDDDIEHKFHVGLLKGDSIVNMLDRMMGLQDSLHFDDLPIPFRCVAVDVNDFEEVVLESGNLPLSMRASMAIPLAFTPVVIDGRTLVDGGLMNNLPVDVARAMGADYVIAVDLTVNKHEGRGIDVPDFFRPKKYLELFNIFRWVVKRPDLSKYRDNVADADVYINPDLKGFSAIDFTRGKIERMIDLGEAAGKKALSDLKKLKKKLRK